MLEANTTVLADQSEPIFLQGKRIVLRPFIEEDIPIFTKWFNSSELRPFLLGNFPLTTIAEKQFMQQIKDNKNNSIVFLVIVVAKKVIGIVSLNKINWQNRTAVSGTVIGETDYWDKGYGTEAKMIFLNYAFNTLNLRKICSDVIEYNKRSLSYSKKCGYKIEGRFKKQIFKKGRYWDEIALAVFKKDWQLLWKQWKKNNLY